MLTKSGDMLFAEKKLRADTWPQSACKSNEIIKNHKNTSFDSLKPFSASYSTIRDDSYGKLEGTATRSKQEGSRKQKNKTKTFFKSDRPIFFMEMKQIRMSRVHQQA